MENLKPCPFCGEKDIRSYEYHDTPYYFPQWKICCLSCAAQFYRATKEDAEAAWNHRAGEEE